MSAAVALCRRPGITVDEVRRALIRDRDEFSAIAALAADPDEPAGARVVALAAVVEACAVCDLGVPEVLADAVDDLALVDAALVRGQPGAVIAALIGLGARADLATTRRRVVRRLVAAGATGLPLAGLAIAIGDVDAGVALAVRDHDRHVAGRGDDPIVRAWRAWLAAQPEHARRAIESRLER